MIKKNVCVNKEIKICWILKFIYIDKEIFKKSNNEWKMYVIMFLFKKYE